MKSQIYKRLALVAMLFSMVFVATDVAAKKPPPKDGPCASMLAPDIAFWRDARTKGKNRMAQIAIYVAESTTSCEAKLLDIPLPEGPINYVQLAYSSDESGGVFMGRVVWAKHRYGGPQQIWKFDFTIEEGQVAPDPLGPKMIMNLEVDGGNLDIRYLDLSPDRLSLVYQFFDDRDSEPNFYRIHTLEISDCVSATCPLGYGPKLYAIEEWPETFEALASPVWGPLGDRIYFIERENDTYYVKFIEVHGTDAEPGTLFSYANEDRIFDISSGIDGSEESLALEIGTDIFIHGCRTIYTLSVEDCEERQICDLQRKFAGTWPSWTKDGKLIHRYLGLKDLDTCRTGTIGSWDGTTLEQLTKGYEPEAAGG